ncbi:MAG: hypothetical protein IJV40_09950 [Oscillospiraceae bacterium]|nr:hypothetical protein [Oscillospiraceae bacterium]
MKTVRKTRRMLIVGIIGCLLYVIGDLGNLLALLPWLIKQLDHGTESFGHALVLMMGLILLKKMAETGEIS